MCGRFTLRASPAELVRSFELLGAPKWRARYNIAPTQSAVAVRHVGEGRDSALLRWGLIPASAEHARVGRRLFNARAETVRTRRQFRWAFKRRRCLVLADGYFEWQRGNRHQQPYLFAMKSGRPFAFAGLWERWEEGPKPIESCAIITTVANELAQDVCDRMPVILPPESYDEWLGPQLDVRALGTLLQPYPADEMEAHPVGVLVNNARNDVSACVEPVEG
jgi:putative SOS response-associated peptidase YedK